MRPQAFAAALALVLPLAAAPILVAQDQYPREQAENARRDNMRFRGMDRNRDGVITQREWRGSDQSFRAHDWNDDGVLSGDEVRVGARRPIDEDEDRQVPSRRRIFYDWTQTGFANADANHDGRITPEEWQYDFESFRRADQNGDDVLSRNEFLNGDVDIDVEDRFDYLDANNNGRIERSEWHSSMDAFRWLDRNRDGVLSRKEVVGEETQQSGSFGPVGTSGSNRSSIITVPSTVRWFDSGIDVRAGDVVAYQAEGNIRMSLGNDNDGATPAGAWGGRRAANAPFPDKPAGALIARIGNATPLFLGDRGEIRAVNAGRLYFSVNDDYLMDNTGDYRVTLTVR